MKTFLVDDREVEGWLRRLAEDGEVYWPQPLGKTSYAYARLRRRSPLRLDRLDAAPDDKPFRASACVVPPGRLLAPMEELLYRFERDDNGGYRFIPCLDQGERIIAGIRPCDLKAIHLMDTVNGDGVPDAHYLTRRARTALVASNCLQPCDEHCFCQAADSLGWREGADIFLTPQADGQQLVECLTPRGEALCQDAGFAPCEDGETRRNDAEARRPQPFGRQFDAPLAEVMAAAAETWDSPVWDKHVERCFSCGTCNLVCPTCYCFDMRDDLDLAQPGCGDRSRCADACMLPEFGEVAGGHNFRAAPAARQRHRVKRKLAYLPGQYADGSFCVGCGRCGHQCTVDIDIFHIANDLVTAQGNKP